MLSQTSLPLIITSLAMNACFATASDQISRLNDSGGSGVYQGDPVFISTPNGALVAWEDETDGRRSIRTRVLNEQGLPSSAPTVVVESIDGTYPSEIRSLTRLNDTTGHLRWERDRFNAYGSDEYGALIDLTTGELLSSVQEFSSYASSVMCDLSGDMWEVSPNALYRLDSSMARIPNQEIHLATETTFSFINQIVFTEHHVVIAHIGVDSEVYDLTPELHVIPLDGSARTIHELDPEMIFVEHMAIAQSASDQIIAYWEGHMDHGSARVHRIQLFDQEGLKTSGPIDFTVPSSLTEFEAATPHALPEGWALFARENNNSESEYWVHMVELDATGAQTDLMSSLLIHNQRAYRSVEPSMGQLANAVELGSSGRFITIAEADIRNQYDLVGGVFETNFSGTYNVSNIAPDISESDASSVRAASNQQGESVVLWSETADIDYGFGYKDAFIKRFDSNGDLVGTQLALETYRNEDPHVMISDEGIVGVYWARWDSVRIARIMPNSMQPEFFTIELNSDRPRYTHNIKLAFEADGSFALGWTSAESIFDAGLLKMQRFDADGMPLTSSPISFGDQGNYYRDGWYLAGLWIDGNNVCAVANRYFSVNLNTDPRFQARLHRINSSGQAVDAGIAFIDQTNFAGLLKAAPGANGHFLTLLGNEYTIYDRTGQNLDIEGTLDQMPSVSSISAGPNGDWLLTGFVDPHYHDGAARGFGVTAHLGGDGSVLYGPYEYAGAEASASSATAAMVGGSRTAFVTAPADVGSGINVLRIDLDGPSCSAADFNCDGQVDGADLTVLLSSWGTADGDLNGDGTTNGIDLTLLLAAWGS